MRQTGGTQLGFAAKAAAAMAIDRIQRNRQLHKRGARAAHRPHRIRHPAGVRKHRHNAGDAALGRYFVDHVSLGLTKLGKGLFQIVEHDGHRAAVDPFFAHRQAA